MRYNKIMIVLMLSFIIMAGCNANKQNEKKGIQNLSEVKSEIIEYYEHGQYDKDMKAIIDSAEAKFAMVKPEKNSAVVFDIDETALSNYVHYRLMDFGYVSDKFNSWVLEGRAPAIKDVKRLYDYLIAKGFKVIFLTGRIPEQYEATKANLIHEGYTKYDTIITKTDISVIASAYKDDRRQKLIGKGYKIEGSVGDQYSDMADEKTSGIKVKLPNFIYYIP